MTPRPFPDLSKVRRVRIEDEPSPQQGRIAREGDTIAAALARQRLTEDDDGR